MKNNDKNDNYMILIDILLKFRNKIDPTIVEWTVAEQISSNSDTFIIKLESSAFLPIKSLIIQRNWRNICQNSIEIIENGYLYESLWSLTPIGDGKTQVSHRISLDLRSLYIHY